MPTGNLKVEFFTSILRHFGLEDNTINSPIPKKYQLLGISNFYTYLSSVSLFALASYLLLCQFFVGTPPSPDGFTFAMPRPSQQNTPPETVWLVMGDEWTAFVVFNNDLLILWKNFPKTWRIYEIMFMYYKRFFRILDFFQKSLVFFVKNFMNLRFKKRTSNQPRHWRIALLPRDRCIATPPWYLAAAGTKRGTGSEEPHNLGQLTKPPNQHSRKRSSGMKLFLESYISGQRDGVFRFRCVEGWDNPTGSEVDLKKWKNPKVFPGVLWGENVVSKSVFSTQPKDWWKEFWR